MLEKFMFDRSREGIDFIIKSKIELNVIRKGASFRQMRLIGSRIAIPCGNKLRNFSKTHSEGLIKGVNRCLPFRNEPGFMDSTVYPFAHTWRNIPMA
jgi:hypothetical protein